MCIVINSVNVQHTINRTVIANIRSHEFAIWVTMYACPHAGLSKSNTDLCTDIDAKIIIRPPYSRDSKTRSTKYARKPLA